MTDLFAELAADGWASESNQVEDDKGHSVTHITFTRRDEWKRLTIGVGFLAGVRRWSSSKARHCRVWQH